MTTGLGAGIEELEEDGPGACEEGGYPRRFQYCSGVIPSGMGDGTLLVVAAELLSASARWLLVLPDLDTGLDPGALLLCSAWRPSGPFGSPLRLGLRLGGVLFCCCAACCAFCSACRLTAACIAAIFAVSSCGVDPASSAGLRENGFFDWGSGPEVFSGGGPEVICLVMMASMSVAALRLRTSSLGGGGAADEPTGTATGGVRVGARGGGLELVEATTDWPSCLSTLSMSCSKNFCFSLSKLTCGASCCPG